MATNIERTPLALVAHRGFAARYPENTLPAVEAALRAGARFVEVDVQLTADHVPVLLHDDTLDRTTNATGRIRDIPFAALAQVRAGEPRRLGSHFRDTPIPGLADLVRLMSLWPDARVFVEIKQESLDAFGPDAVVDAVTRRFSGRPEQFIPISFNADAVRLARARGAPAIGWVLERYDGRHHRMAESLAPEFLFCNFRKLPADASALWPGPWHWVLYEVTEPALALELGRRGAGFIESMVLDAYVAAPWSLTIDDRAL